MIPLFYVIEFDYSNDSELEFEIKNDLKKEFGDSITVVEDIVLVDTIEEALKIKFRAAENIIGIFPQYD